MSEVTVQRIVVEYSDGGTTEIDLDAASPIQQGTVSTAVNYPFEVVLVEAISLAVFDVENRTEVAHGSRR
jgi:hypothetical protein